MDNGNPLIPAGADILWSVISAIVIALAVTALILLARSAAQLTMTQAVIWTLVILFVPVLGPVAWLAVRRRTQASARSAQP